MSYVYTAEIFRKPTHKLNTKAGYNISMCGLCGSFDTLDVPWKGVNCKACLKTKQPLANNLRMEGR